MTEHSAQKLERQRDAAPEMYEALKVIIDEWAELTKAVPPLTNQRGYQLALAAITKAETPT